MITCCVLFNIGYSELWRVQQELAKQQQDLTEDMKRNKARLSHSAGRVNSIHYYYDMMYIIVVIL